MSASTRSWRSRHRHGLRLPSSGSNWQPLRSSYTAQVTVTAAVVGTVNGMTNSAPEARASCPDVRAVTETLVQRARAELRVLDAVPDGGAHYTQALLSDLIDRLQDLTEQVVSMTGERDPLDEDTARTTAPAPAEGGSR